jgi:hypothetical protein
MPGPLSRIKDALQAKVTCGGCIVPVLRKGKKISLNVGVFFVDGAAPENGPRPPRDPPQLHHENTTVAHRNF